MTNLVPRMALLQWQEQVAACREVRWETESALDELGGPIHRPHHHSHPYQSDQEETIGTAIEAAGTH
jgi:hypothetical protein